MSIATAQGPVAPEVGQTPVEVRELPRARATSRGYVPQIHADEPSRRVLRNPSRAWTFGAAATFAVGALVLHDPAWRFFLGGLAVSALFLASWPRLIVTPDALVVINVFRHRVDWQDIVSIEAATWYMPKGPPSLSLMIASDKRRRPLRSWAVTSNTRGVGVNTDWVEHTADVLERERRERTRTVP